MTLIDAGRGAEIDVTGRYRYRLWRKTSDSPTDNRVLFVMLNPSTADALVDDPTVRRCVGFAQREGADRLDVVNLFGLRSPKPHLLRLADDPVGPDNDRHIAEAAADADLVVLAYGSLKYDSWLARADDVLGVLSDRHGGILWTLGSTANGCPRHPLYVAADQPLEAF